MAEDSIKTRNRIEQTPIKFIKSSSKNKLKDFKNVLNLNFDFHGMSTNYSSHNFHAFAAKFPPQIPQIFINNLTQEFDTILDPMMGSGTTLVEAILLSRNAIGVDLDPLAQLICKIKTNRISELPVKNSLSKILTYLNFQLKNKEIQKWNENHFDEKTKQFIDFWFKKQTQLELASLMISIEEVVHDEMLKDFFYGIFSSIIITKSGGVSLARDLAHTRPHRDLKKKPKNAIDQFRVKAEKSIKALETLKNAKGEVKIISGDSRNLTIPDNSIDFIITSPPYANAIDYMRAHKFSLTWFGWPIDKLSNLRSNYIGSEKLKKIDVILPIDTLNWCKKIGNKDIKKGNILKQYFNDISISISEMYRVLKNENATIIIIGKSTIRNIEIPTHICFKEIAEEIGFKCIKISERKLERNKRMMPIAHNSNKNGIENRIHNEYILGLWKD